MRSEVAELVNSFGGKDTVVLHDAGRGEWLHFREPVRVVQTAEAAQVRALLQEVETQVHEEKLFSAGFLAYEAAPGFDPTLKVRQGDEFPLLWFGLYQEPQRIEVRDIGQAEPVGDLTWKPSLTAARYLQAVSEIKRQIAAGRTYQVNYTLRMRTSFHGAGLAADNAQALFWQLIRAQEPSYGAYIDTGRYAICCASPELFFRREGSKVWARPMKGTAARGLTWEEDQAQATWLHHSEKNRAENVMIVDMIRNDLGRVADVGTVDAPQLFNVEKYPNVWQMTSTVTARTAHGVTPLLQALFPCASITGAPKHSTMGTIAELEDEPRRIYTGTIGYLTPQGTAQFNVAIRTVLVDRQEEQAEYGVGGGIVWDSTGEGEWQECIAKARILTLRRPSFSLLETLLWRRGDGYVLLEYHLKRLARSADYFDYKLDIANVRQRLAQAARRFSGPAYRVRLLVNKEGGVTLQTAGVTVEVGGIEVRRVCLAPAPVSSSDLFLYHKTTHRDTYERMQASCPEFDDVILWNERDEITESCLANVVVELDGERVTPPISSGLLAGTYRQWLLDQGLVRERVVLREDLARCGKIWLVNSVRGEVRAMIEQGLPEMEVA